MTMGQTNELGTAHPPVEPRAAEAVPEITILMPCLNEAETVEGCIAKARRGLADVGAIGEIVIADNGSTDGSRKIAENAGARVICVEERGYGAALIAGIEAARGKYVIMGDADDSYDFEKLGAFIEQLRRGNDLVMGNRFRGGILPGAMPTLHRYLGNPVLTGVGRLLFGSSCGDFHCGMRGFNREAIGRLNLRTTGMEFASEMVVKATLHGLRIAEVPTTLRPDGRNRPPHLRSWRDGWRHLRFLLLFSPRWLFLYPGLALMTLGTVLGLWLMPGPRRVGTVELDIHTLMYAGAAVLLGFQAVAFAVFTKVFATSERLLPQDRRLEAWLGRVTLETGLLAGGLLFAAGLILSVMAVGQWKGKGFGSLEPRSVARIVVPAVTLLTLGCQVVLSSFFLSVLRLKLK
jgi:hypothetical protein